MTVDPDYTHRLRSLESVWWKRVLDVQAPYRWNVRRLDLGYTLDVGCGIGRNLSHLGGNGVGVDHNPTSVDQVRSRGLAAYTPEEFHQLWRQKPKSFDSILAAHVIEHIAHDDVEGLIREYLPYLRPGGKLCLIVPQERGYETDSTHVWLPTRDDLRTLLSHLGFRVERLFSFPFPHAFGRVFAYNETVIVGIDESREPRNP